MVNVCLYTGEEPPDDTSDDVDRKILRTEPIYAADTILELAEASRVILWSRGAITEAQKWGFDNDDVCELVMAALRTGKYRESVWCLRGNGSKRTWAACDVYTFSRVEEVSWSAQRQTMTYYVKLAIGRTGQMLLIASCHPERWKI